MESLGAGARLTSRRTGRYQRDFIFVAVWTYVFNDHASDPMPYEDHGYGHTLEVSLDEKLFPRV